jgi:hypothetical protein
MMVRSGTRARNLNFEMPFPGMHEDTREVSMKAEEFRGVMSHVLSNAPHILLPNGKIFLTTEQESFARIAEKEAKKSGFSVRRKPLPHPRQTQKIGANARSFIAGFSLVRLEITFPLRKAFPAKKDRRAWPKV